VKEEGVEGEGRRGRLEYSRMPVMSAERTRAPSLAGVVRERRGNERKSRESAGGKNV